MADRAEPVSSRVGRIERQNMKKPIEACYRMFGMRVEQIRSALGMSQEQLANAVGLTRTSITNIEAGRQRVLLHDVERFATVLHVTPKHLMRGIWT